MILSAIISLIGIGISIYLHRKFNYWENKMSKQWLRDKLYQYDGDIRGR